MIHLFLHRSERRLPPALSVMEIQSISGQLTSSLAKSRALTALRSLMPPRTDTSSVPIRKRED
jgi:hypothetical protein